jgi:hypothetical protein
MEPHVLEWALLVAATAVGAVCTGLLGRRWDAERE